MKYTVKLLLQNNKANEHGHLPIYIRITIDRKKSYISTGYYIPSKLWDQKNQAVEPDHLQAAIINADITNRKTAIMQRIVEMNMQGKAISAPQVKEQFSRKANLHNIFDFIDEHIKNVQHKRAAGTLENYAKYSRKLELFHGSRQLTFEEMDVNFLQRYEDSLRKEGLAGNYIHQNFKMLMTFFNAARRRELITCYPFKNYENPTYLVPDKDWLSLEELDRWEAYADEVRDPVDKQTAVYFLLGCYTGLRLSDWYQFDLKKHVRGKSILLRTTKNGEWVTMPITARLKRTLIRIEKIKLTIDEPVINRTLKDIAKVPTVKIDKYLKSHSGRQTFAVTMCAEQGIGVEVCAELMGITIATCAENYYKTTKTKINKECLEAWKDI